MSEGRLLIFWLVINNIFNPKNCQEIFGYEDIFKDNLDLLMNKSLVDPKVLRNRFRNAVLSGNMSILPPPDNKPPQSGRRSQNFSLTPNMSSDYYNDIMQEMKGVNNTNTRKRMEFIHLEMLLDKSTLLPDTGGNNSFYERNSRRFSQLVKENTRRMGPGTNKQALREYYDNFLGFITFGLVQLNWPILKQKKAIIDLMMQVIYTTRAVKLPVAQAFRDKYKHLTKFQIGYVFQVLRILKMDQMHLQMFYQMNRYEFYYLQMYARVFEKMLRLQTDLKDLIDYIRALNKKRLTEERPDSIEAEYQYMIIQRHREGLWKDPYE